MRFGGELHLFEPKICKYIFNPVFTNSIMNVGNVCKIEMMLVLALCRETVEEHTI